MSETKEPQADNLCECGRLANACATADGNPNHCDRDDPWPLPVVCPKCGGEDLQIDLVANGEVEAQWDELFATAAALFRDVPVYTVLGNHEREA